MDPSNVIPGARSTGWGAAAAHRTLTEHAYNLLHDGIVSGRYPAGSRLAVSALAEELNTSPMPIREALVQLAAHGLVDHLPHRGARVRAMSVDDLAEVSQAQLALEPLAVSLAAGRLTEVQVQAAWQSLERIDAADANADIDEARRADWDFHFCLYRAAGSEWLLRLISPVWESIERYRHIDMTTMRDPSQRRLEHRSILEACAAGDGDTAARYEFTHVALSANHLARQLGHEGDLFPAQPTGWLPPHRLS